MLLAGVVQIDPFMTAVRRLIDCRDQAMTREGDPSEPSTTPGRGRSVGADVEQPSEHFARSGFGGVDR
jgi:hypothetical protein